MSADFSETLGQARRDWEEGFAVMGSEDQQPRLLYSQPYHLEWRGSYRASRTRQSERSSPSPSHYFVKC